MPVLEVQDYERFNYDEPGVPLSEAIKKAQELRKKDATNFYRIEHTDASQTMFRVSAAPVRSVYAEFITKMANFMFRSSSRRRSRVR